MKTLGIALVLTLLTSAGAQEDITIKTGNDLRMKCKLFFNDVVPNTMTDTERFEMGYCAGYFDGVTTIEQDWQQLEGNTSKASHFCLPSEVTNGQIILVIKKYFGEHPDQLHEAADLLIHRAMVKAFPCKR